MAYTKHVHPLNDGVSAKTLNEMEDGIFNANKNATTAVVGLVKQAEAIDDLTGETVTVEDFNGLLAKLRTAGILATAE